MEYRVFYDGALWNLLVGHELCIAASGDFYYQRIRLFPGIFPDELTCGDYSGDLYHSGNIDRFGDVQRLQYSGNSGADMGYAVCKFCRIIGNISRTGGVVEAVAVVPGIDEFGKIAASVDIAVSSGIWIAVV